MRTTLAVGLLGLSALVATGAAGRANDQADARGVVDRAIQAAGGAEALARHNAATWKEKGTYYGMGSAVPYTGSYAVQWPDRFRMEVDGVFTIVLDGDKGWVRANDETKDMTPQQLREQQAEHYAGWVTTLLPL